LVAKPVAAYRRHRRADAIELGYCTTRPPATVFLSMDCEFVIAGTEIRKKSQFLVFLNHKNSTRH